MKNARYLKTVFSTHLQFLNILFSYYKTNTNQRDHSKNYKEENKYPQSLPGWIIQTVSDANILAHFFPVFLSSMFIFVELKVYCIYNFVSCIST